MKNLYLSLLVIFLGSYLQAQDPSIIWQKTIGGNTMDVVYSLQQTSDGGYILGGYSNSNASGEKSENSRGGIDAWIVKMDASGNLMWDKTYGGSGDDFLTSIKETLDGGFIVGMGSNSNISGDKSENSRGGTDFWILKLNAAGELDWQKTYGGAQPEFDTNIFPTVDGGYFVTGYSDSDISGDKTVPSKGQRDYWVLKLNNSGEINWQKAVGGNTVDRLIVSMQTEDGGYILGGHSDSNISGDKSENNRGLFDNWLVKLSGDGTIEWNKTYGGNDNDLVRDIIQIEDGFMVGGYSHSGISGDKTGELRGVIDYWVYKINNDGNMVWQKTIGGNQTDYLRTIRRKSDGNYLVTGYSNSNVSGEKTENSNGGYDMWFLLLDPNGEILGQNTIGGAADESAGYSVILDDGYLFAVASESNQSGDKSENSRGEEDYWIFKTNFGLLGLDDLQEQSTILIYPNPIKDQFTIDLGKVESKIQIKITDSTGKLVYKQNYSNTQKVPIVFNVSTGIYFLSVQLENNKTITKKLIKL